MLKVTLFYDNHKCVGFDARDHAGYAVSGEDIVCASASMLITNTINSIEKFTDDKFSNEVNEKDAEIVFQFSGIPSEKSKLLIEAMILGLQSLEEEYTDYVDIIFEEVHYDDET
ncbi:MAG: ribosomal-processing cysteine protease Prp [Lachnospiraceae bacterium]|jgi:uncharacterized protein YsxB (DUF464 family)|nr:ribosomal-processing cysteine protease Prp [Lachnospiraceae bacterium]